VIISATDHPESDQETNRVYSLNLADAKMMELAAPRGPFGRLRVSPDGKSLTYVAAKVDGPTPHDLFLLSATGGPSRNLTSSSIDRPIQAYAWTSNSALMAVVQNGFKTNLTSITVSGAADSSQKLPLNPRAFEMSATGALAFVGNSGMEAEELWLQEKGKPALRVSEFNKSWRQLSLAQPEPVHFKSFDGLEIEGALLKPRGYSAGTPAPLIVLVHGGPTGAWQDSIETWGQLLAADGFAVFYPTSAAQPGTDSALSK